MTIRNKCHVCGADLHGKAVERIIFENTVTDKSVHYVVCQECTEKVMGYISMNQCGGKGCRAMIKRDDNLEYMRSEENY